MQLERVIAAGQLMRFTFTQDKVADSQTAVAMNRGEVSDRLTQVTLVAGGSAGAHTVTGIATADRLVFVGHLSTAASIATLGDLTAEFTISAADTIDNTSGTDTTNDQLMVIWEDADAGADTLALTEFAIPFPFELVGIAVSSTEARTAGTLTADATIDGTATGLQAVLDATNTTRDTARQLRNSDRSSSGGRIGVKLTTSSWTPTTADIAVDVYAIVYLEGI